MRILTQHHDYYDGLMAYDRDPEPFYARRARDVTQYRRGPLAAAAKAAPVPLLEAAWLSRYSYSCGPRAGRRGDLVVVQHTVLFCGSVYPLLDLNPTVDSPGVRCRTLEEVDTYVAANYDREIVAKGYRAPRREYYSRHWDSATRRPAFEDFFAATAAAASGALAVHRRYASPIVVVRVDRDGLTVTVDANLGAIGFARVVDPHTAYQELAMFLGGVLGTPMKEPPAIADEVMAEIKGFDARSFRKDPTKPRRNR